MGKVMNLFIEFHIGVNFHKHIGTMYDLQGFFWGCIKITSTFFPNNPYFWA